MGLSQKTTVKSIKKLTSNIFKLHYVKARFMINKVQISFVNEIIKLIVYVILQKIV